MIYTESISLSELIASTGDKPKDKAKRSSISGIRSRKGFRRFIFRVKSTESYSSSKGHLTSIHYPSVDLKSLKKGRNPSVAKTDVNVWCTCPAFHYWGSHYWATQDDYLMFDKDAEDRFPIVRDPQGENLVCKHIIRVYKRINRTPLTKLVDQFQGVIKKKRSSLEDLDEEPLSFIDYTDTVPIVSQYLRERKYTDSEITEVISSLSFNNYEDVLKEHRVII